MICSSFVFFVLIPHPFLPQVLPWNLLIKLLLWLFESSVYWLILIRSPLFLEYEPPGAELHSIYFSFSHSVHGSTCLILGHYLTKHFSDHNCDQFCMTQSALSWFKHSCGCLQWSNMRLGLWAVMDQGGVYLSLCLPGELLITVWFWGWDSHHFHLYIHAPIGYFKSMDTQMILVKIRF